MSERFVGRCINCRHDFRTGPCGGCGALPDPRYEPRCDGECSDDCALCGSSDPRLWCDDCRAYAAQDAEATR